MSRRRVSLAPPWLAALSLTVGMALRILPLPTALAWANPDWVLLFLIYWVLATPEYVGIGTGWFTGLLADALTGRSLGQHALAYCLVAFCCLRFHNRLRFYSLAQQSFCIGLFLALSQLIVAWTQEPSSRPLTVSGYLLPALSGALLWPAIAGLMQQLRSASETT